MADIVERKNGGVWIKYSSIRDVCAEITRTDLSNALIAAAYEDAAEVAFGSFANGTGVRDEILAQTPADAQAALDRMLAQAREDGLRDAAEKLGNLHAGFTYRPKDMRRHVMQMIKKDKTNG